MKPLHQFKNIFNPYTNNVGNEQPSLHEEANITDSVKPIERKDADIEVEKDELILKPDLSGIYKAKGKTHAQGGIPIKAEPGSFVFSHYKNLALSKDEQELLQLKKGGPIGDQKNTPAEVVKRNVDIKHYNRMVNNLADMNKDIISKKTSALMLSKYRDIMGRVAFAQEAKKNFEGGVPEWAQDTAPAVDPELQYNIDKQEQYKLGGMTKNPYSDGGETPCPCGKDSNGKCLPCSPAIYKEILNNKAKRTDIVPPGYEHLYDENGTKLYGKFDSFGKAIATNGPKMSNEDWTRFINSPAGKASRAKRMMVDTENYLRTDPKYGFIGPPEFDYGTPKPKDVLNPTNPDRTTIPYEPNVQKTMPMLVDEMWAGVDAASVKKYNPYRQQIKSQLVDFARYNPQTAVNRINQASNSAYQATRGLNPYQAQSTINEVYGKSLDNIAQVQGQYDERNVGVENQQNVSNAQIQNKDAQDNITFDKRYYDEQTLSNQRFDNAKTYAWGQFRDVRDQHQEELDSLYNVMAQQPIAGSKPLLNANGSPRLDKNGKQIFQSMPLYDVVPGTIRTRYTGYGNILNTPGYDKSGYDYMAQYNQVLEELRNAPDPQTKKALAATLNSLGTMIKYQSIPRKRNGGIVNPYK